MQVRKNCRLVYLILAVSMFTLGNVSRAAEGIQNSHNEKTEKIAGSDVVASAGNSPLVRIDRFIVKGNTLLDAGLIERLLAPYQGDTKSYSDIQHALESLEGAYRSAGYSAVHVVTPEQEITEGLVTLQVIESMIGKVTLNGNEHYDKANIRNALPALSEGFTPSARALSENIRLANENPTRQIDVVLALGEEENTIDARVNVQDSSPRKVFLTLDNTGNQGTGMYRAGVGLQHNNLFNRDHAATFNYVTSPNHVNDVTQLSASYRLPLYSVGDSIDLIAAYSDTNAGTTSTVAGPLSFSGKGRVYSARYNHYLPRRGEYTSKVIAGIDHRAYINECSLGVFGAAGCGSAAFDVTVHPASLAYNGTLTRPTYIADFTTTLLRNIAGGPQGRAFDFNAVRPSPAGGEGAEANYAILRLNGSLAGVLPQDWQYRLAGSAQYTHDALVSGESFGVVGANAVRGFLEREMYSSDKGYVLNAELYSPELAQDLKMTNGSFRLLGFVDHGNGWNTPLAGDTIARNKAASVGAGFRFSYGKNLAARLDYARVTEASGTSKTGDRRGHISVMATW
jgi:hemolysin activation/secretion protein